MPFCDPDFSAVAAVMKEAAETLVCPRFQHLNQDCIQTKTHQNDLVTIADIETEAFLTTQLTTLLPGSVAMGEESVYQTPQTKAVLDGEAPVWVIDPIDGTANYARGKPEFAIIVALVERGVTTGSWIYAPLMQRLYTAGRGCGAWYQDKKLSIQNASPYALQEMVGCMGRRLAERHKGSFAAIDQRGSAAHDYMALCDGRLNFRLFRLLCPWDHAAGVLMVEEAGGYVRLLSEQSYKPRFYDDDGLLIAPNPDAWGDLRQCLGL